MASSNSLEFLPDPGVDVRQLFILLHGVGGSPDNLEPLALAVRKAFPAAAVLVPEGFEPFDGGGALAQRDLAGPGAGQRLLGQGQLREDRVHPRHQGGGQAGGAGRVLEGLPGIAAPGQFRRVARIGGSHPLHVRLPAVEPARVEYPVPFQAFQAHDGQGAQLGGLELVEFLVDGPRDRLQAGRQRVGRIGRRNPFDHAFSVTVVGIGAQRNVRHLDRRRHWRRRLGGGRGLVLSVRGAEQARHQHRCDQAEKRLGMGAHVAAPVGGCCGRRCGGASYDIAEARGRGRGRSAGAVRGWNVKRPSALASTGPL